MLILDDEESVRESLVDFFEDRGWGVLSASTSEEAFDLLKHEKVAGAIVDIRLPGVDGNEFMRVVSEIHPTLACVVSTGSPEYHTPKDLVDLPQVSKKIFSKPVVDLKDLEKALCVQIEKCSTFNFK